MEAMKDEPSESNNQTISQMGATLAFSVVYRDLQPSHNIIQQPNCNDNTNLQKTKYYNNWTQFKLVIQMMFDLRGEVMSHCWIVLYTIYSTLKYISNFEKWFMYVGL